MQANASYGPGVHKIQEMVENVAYEQSKPLATPACYDYEDIN